MAKKEVFPQSSHYSRKSQASVEYLMVAALAFMIVIPMIYLLYSYTSDVNSEVTDTKVQKIADDILNSAERIWYLGEPSRTTLRVDMPEGVMDVKIEGEDLVFYVGNELESKEIVRFSNIPIQSLLTPQDLAAGKHNIKIEATKDFVVLYSGDRDISLRKACALHLASQIIKNAENVLQAQQSRYVELERECVFITIDPKEGENGIFFSLPSDEEGSLITLDMTIDLPLRVDGEDLITMEVIGWAAEIKGFNFIDHGTYVEIVPMTSPDCGDGILQSIAPGTEQCDKGSSNGNGISGCSEICEIEIFVCGDGIAEGNEECDDSNDDNFDTCPNDCIFAVCDDGIIEGLEECDSASVSNGICDSCGIICNPGYTEDSSHACITEANVCFGDQSMADVDILTTGSSRAIFNDGSRTFLGADTDFVVFNSNNDELGRIELNGEIYDIEVVGTTAYVVNNNGFVVLDVNANEPIILGRFNLVETIVSKREIKVVGTIAYIADHYNGLVILDVANPSTPEVLGTYDTADIAVDVSVVGNIAYIADRHKGLVILNVANPSTPEVLGTYDTLGMAIGVSVVGTIAYIADHNKGLVILNVANPSTPEVLGTYNTPESYTWDVSIVGNKAYIADYSNGLIILNVENPNNPSFLGKYDTLYSAVDVSVVGNKAYVAYFDGGSFIIDLGPLCSAGAPQVCGNGAVEGTEVCDDGNTLGGDTCPANCQVSTFPILNAGTGQCMYNIQFPGYYVLPNDVISTLYDTGVARSGICIDTSDVVLDCASHSITSPIIINNNNAGVLVQTSSLSINNVLVKGCTTNDYKHGIFFGPTVSGSILSGNTINGGTIGITFSLGATSNTIYSNTINGGTIGIDFSLGATSNTICGNTYPLAGVNRNDAQALADGYINRGNVNNIVSTTCQT